MFLEKAYAKINLYLKITGFENGFHTLNSRFYMLDDLYDTISFVPQKCHSFTIEGMDAVALKENTIYKAFVAINDYTGDLDILDFFYNHKVVIDKKIPTMAGLGGGSSDAAAFLRLINQACSLRLSSDTLAQIGTKVGADVAFFIYNYRCANVSGFGDIIKPFEEECMEFELFFPYFGCDTTLVYKTFKEHFLKEIAPIEFTEWQNLPYGEILKKTKSDRSALNDLYKAALLIYPELEKQRERDWFFSGSGSTFFKLR